MKGGRATTSSSWAGNASKYSLRMRPLKTHINNPPTTCKLSRGLEREDSSPSESAFRSQSGSQLGSEESHSEESKDRVQFVRVVRQTNHYDVLGMFQIFRKGED
ncbi:hypothetical protein H5410_015099 [Solanum commersonii]|uniref:Uncharacterized protein n=1 Tax=Solanum commersonii TaxID=4109 RepID=A0A9J5ZT43_SOLCO|nr:hypothetical protein H5410_015099 [Solanum commersonii]